MIISWNIKIKQNMKQFVPWSYCTFKNYLYLYSLLLIMHFFSRNVGDEWKQMTINFPFFLHKITWYNSILWRACTLYRNKQAYYNSLFLSHIVTYQRWTRTFTTYMYLLMKISSIISAFAVVTQSIRSYILLENSKRVKCIHSIIYCIAHQYQWMFYTFSFYHF